MRPIDIDEVYTPQEVAKFLRCSTWTVNAMIDRGDLPALVLTVGKKKMRRVTRSSLEKFLACPNALVPKDELAIVERNVCISNVTRYLKRKKK